MVPITYRPTHDRTIPSPDQVIATESKNILLRHFYQHGADKMKTKRASPESPDPEPASKVPRACANNDTTNTYNDT
ncbi:Unknown protein [Striga hermonthica]|uniref:DET1- and DDB1-associated protein 1 domain-containing protein n=1 Tax=Striga hermonthica TaxID=68872 RepID=A0A9N7RMQ0_STRHE|nr:Unknown protein [Striga hermonthica]